MEDFSSKNKLNAHADGYVEAGNASLPWSLKTAIRKKTKRGSHESQYSGGCVLFIGFTAFAFMAIMLFIAIFYIERLLVRVEGLEQRVQKIEEKATRMCSCQKEVNDNGYSSGSTSPNNKDGADDMNIRDGIDKDNKNDGVPFEAKSRTKRFWPTFAPRGISSSSIAMVFGSRDKLQEAMQEDHGSPLYFNTSDRQKMGCLKGFKQMKNGYDDYWCKPAFSTQPDTVMLTKDNELYHYFKKAEWMNSANSLAKYNLTQSGKVIVLTSGIYIVHASIHFTHVQNYQFPRFGVYKTSNQDQKKILISKCIVSVLKISFQDPSAIHPCQVWQIAEHT